MDYSALEPFPSYAHQLEDVLRFASMRFSANFSEMGTGKTKTIIDTAQLMYHNGLIDRVIITTPQGLRGEWYHPEIGQIRGHIWKGTRHIVTEYHAKVMQWRIPEDEGEREQAMLYAPPGEALRWIVTNYEFLQSSTNIKVLSKYATARTLLIVEESSYIKSHKAARTKATMQLRQKCGYVHLINGTPIANHPGDMFSQGNIMSPTILACPSYTQFRGRYAELAPILKRGGEPLKSKRGFVIQQEKSWNIEDLERRFAPYVVRRLKSECLDLPEKLPPVEMPVTLTPATWKHYVAMRDDMVSWLRNEGRASLAPQIITKIMRLAQLTSGFLGGVRDIDLGENDPSLVFGDDPAASGAPRQITLLGGIPIAATALNGPPPPTTIHRIGNEKREALLDWSEIRLHCEPNFKWIILSRFRPEMDAIMEDLAMRFKHLPIYSIRGKQSKQEREAAIRAFRPDAPAEPAALILNPQSGGLGLNLTGAWHMFSLSRDYSHYRAAQADDRIHRIGQVRQVGYTNAIAVGPRGQKTVDHAIFGRLAAKAALAQSITEFWASALEDSDACERVSE